VERHQLDAWLIEKASRAGARVIPQKASGIGYNGSGFTVCSGGQRFKSQWLIGADGAVSLTKRRLNFSQRSHIFTALVEERPLPPQLSSMLEGGALIELNGVPGGYGWLFARGKVLNMGIGSWGWKRRSSNNRFKEAYSAFLKRYALGEPGSYRGAAIPCPVAWAQTPVKGRAIWVGDAAALADPFLGEGIGQAICAGLQAARAILKNDLSIYINSLKKGIFREHLHAWLLARLIYSRPGLSHRLVMRHPGALELGFGLLRGDVTHQTLWMFVLRKLLALNPSLDHTTQSNYIKILK
jgi:flavin-dependent dehydrogenase